MLDYEIPVDITEIKEVIRTSDVMLVRFPLFDKRLLLDARQDTEVGPMIRVVERANSAAARFRSLKQMRPRFPAPKNIISFTWPKYVNSLAAAGVWQAIVDRCTVSGQYDTDDECQKAFEELLDEERKAIVGAITGDGCETLWERGKKNKS